MNILKQATFDRNGMVTTGMVMAGMVLCTKEGINRYDPIFATSSCDQQISHPKPVGIAKLWSQLPEESRLFTGW